METRRKGFRYRGDSCITCKYLRSHRDNKTYCAVDGTGPEDLLQITAPLRSVCDSHDLRDQARIQEMKDEPAR